MGEKNIPFYLQNILHFEKLITWREGSDLILIRFEQTVPSEWVSEWSQIKSEYGAVYLWGKRINNFFASKYIINVKLI